MTSFPFLSICIPTRNRAALLRELLESIASQIEPEVEVVISDDGSTDATPQVAEEFRSRFSHLRYERHDPALLYDRNILHVVSQARGEFCWLFSDDDRMEPSALSAVLKELRADLNLAGLTTGRVAYDFPLTRRLPVRGMTTTATTTFTDADHAFVALLDRIGFLSCQVINRADWNEAVQSTHNLERYFTNYVQLYLIVRMMQRRPRWRFLAQECVAFRADNDSFRALGSTGRLKMDVVSYELITGDVFGRKSGVYRAAMSEVSRTHVRHHIIDAKRRGAPTSFTWRALALCLPRYWKYPAFWLRTFPVLVAPRGLMLALRRLYQRRADD
ncbi:MAG: glycosyltransferase family 2 protein [Chthoniobacterales bacterium]